MSQKESENAPNCSVTPHLKDNDVWVVTVGGDSGWLEASTKEYARLRNPLTGRIVALVEDIKSWHKGPKISDTTKNIETGEVGTLEVSQYGAIMHCGKSVCASYLIPEPLV
jgi:hypothetical protein